MNKPSAELMEKLAKDAGYQIRPDGHIFFYAGDENAIISKYTSNIISECISVLKKRFVGEYTRENLEVRRCIVDLENHWYDLKNQKHEY
jgi:hypothetical protein